jgi:hypothetical protein
MIHRLTTHHWMQPWLWLMGWLAATAWTAPLAALTDSAVLAKIGFDLEQLDQDGLYGPTDGKRSLDYEFCLPRYDAAVATEVRSIDPSLRLYPASSGRIGCTADQVLAIGNTHQANARGVLLELASRDEIQRIEQTDWE